MAGLNREITIPGITGKKKGGRPTELPQKNAINLAQGVSGTQNRTMTLIAFGAAVIVIVILCKLLVIDVLAGAMASNGQVSRMESQVQELVAANEDYDQVSKEYSRYVVTGLTDDELQQVDRQQVIGLVRSYLLDLGQLQSMQVSGNVVTANVAGVSMARVSQRIKLIQADPLVASAQVSSAQGAESSLSSNAVHTVVITLAGAQAESASGNAAEAGSGRGTVYEALTGDELHD